MLASRYPEGLKHWLSSQTTCPPRPRSLGEVGSPMWLSAPSTSGCGSRVTVKGAAGRGERAGALLIAAHPAWLGEGEPAGIPAGTSRRLGSLVDQRNQ